MMTTLKGAVKKTPLWPLLRPRRIHVYGVGAPKTGTTSIFSLFSKNYRSVHEAHLIQTTDLLEKRVKGSIDRQQLTKEIRRRDRRWRLECESAHYIAHFCDVLAKVFPRAKFILTVREPRSWLRSMIDQCIKKPRSGFLKDGGLDQWVRIRDMCFGSPPDKYAPPESVLAKHNLHTLDGYLAYWARHNRMVLDAVPHDRLLVIRTRDLSKSIDRIASFADVASTTLSRGKSHSNKARKKHGLLNEIDEHYVQKKINEHCTGVVKRLEKTAAVPLT